MRQKFGKYELVEVIGEGGMAEVFLARVIGPMGVSRFVALKRVHPFKSVDPKLIQMFIDEARLVVRLIHPNIVAVQDFGIENECYYLAMEFVEGQDLRHVLQRASEIKRPMPVECALYIIASIARGLHYAHTLADSEGRPLGIVHRDVSPSNILVTYGGDVKLADFGIARASAQIRQNVTEAGTIKGKICYMSPEQARGEPIDQRSDLFPLGTILLELITLSSAFKGESDMTSLRNVQSGVPRFWEDIKQATPDDVLALLDRIMTVDRRDRFETGALLAQDAELALRRRSPGFGARDLQTYMESVFAVERAQQRERLSRYERGVEIDNPSTLTVDIEIERDAGGAGASVAEANAPTRTLADTPSARLPTHRPTWPKLVLPAVAASVALLAAGVTISNARLNRLNANAGDTPLAGQVGGNGAAATVTLAPPVPSGRPVGRVMLSTNAIGTRVFLDKSAKEKSAAPVAAGGMSLRVTVPADVDWVLRVEADGYAPTLMPLKIGAGEEMTIPLGLTPLAVEKGRPVSAPRGDLSHGKRTPAKAPQKTAREESSDTGGKNTDENKMVDPF